MDAEACSSASESSISIKTLSSGCATTSTSTSSSCNLKTTPSTRVLTMQSYCLEMAQVRGHPGTSTTTYPGYPGIRDPGTRVRGQVYRGTASHSTSDKEFRLGYPDTRVGYPGTPVPWYAYWGFPIKSLLAAAC
eukprot:187770-Rhodomonas_salina.2